MDNTGKAAGPTAEVSDGCIVSNHRIGSAGTVMGEPFVNDLGTRLVWVKYDKGVRVERIDDLIELGIFKPAPYTDQQWPDAKNKS